MIFGRKRACDYVLDFIAEFGEIRPTELARKLGVTRVYASQLLAILLAEGRVVRRPAELGPGVWYDIAPCKPASDDGEAQERGK